jgi:hypothetical protein
MEITRFPDYQITRSCPHQRIHHHLRHLFRHPTHSHHRRRHRRQRHAIKVVQDKFAMLSNPSPIRFVAAFGVPRTTRPDRRFDVFQFWIFWQSGVPGKRFGLAGVEVRRFWQFFLRALCDLCG